MHNTAHYYKYKYNILTTMYMGEKMYEQRGTSKKCKMFGREQHSN